MTSNRKRYFTISNLLACLLLVMSPLISYADEPVSLSIKPLACIVKTQGQPCELNVTAHWQTNVPMNLCLYQRNNLIQCWKKQRQALKRFSIEITESTEFRLLNSKQEVVASVQIAINAATPTRYRRRLRADWSVF